MKELRIIFMGTPEFAVESLKAIVEAGNEVVGVITAPDRPAGRGRKVQESAVKKFALENNLKILQPTNLKSEGFLKELKSLDANLQVVVAFRMLPEQVWKMPEFGTFNLHASLLPQYRGAAPINWAIINGEKETGVTTFFIDEKIDNGELILQEKVLIAESENAGDLHDKLMETGASLVLNTLEQIKDGKIQSFPQPQENVLNMAPKLNKENTKIDWKAPVSEIYNLIRGLSPYPAAWTILENGNEKFNIKIYEAEKEKISHNLEIGKIIQEGKEMKIAVSEGFVLIKEIQFPGKRKMKIKEFLNGYTFFPNAKVL